MIFMDEGRIVEDAAPKGTCWSGREILENPAV